MGRPKKTAPKHVEPEDESQEAPEEEPEVEEDEPEASGKAISKAAAVRDALEQGEDSPEDGVTFIKKVHGIEMTRQTFSSYKAQEKARQAKKGVSKGKPGRKPKAVAPVPKAPLVEGFVAPPEKPKAVGEPDVLLALEGVKELVSQFGADRVKKMVDLLS
jgi:hypothetical protein